ncbi:unnamed protein product [Urochloa decumbens]|uniref:Uncharacterized protein n=1 Tax=Urochloa decumbens TaxID=240449 RepID=A0ABC9G3P6_9POAL
MPDMRHNNSLVNLLDKRLHQLPTSKMMKISKSAPNLVKKAAASFKSKTDALRTRLIILASLRHRLAMACSASRQIHALVASDGGREKQAMLEYGSKALALHKAAATSEGPSGGDGGKVLRGLFEVAMYEEGYHGYPEWTNSLFDDDNCYNDEEDNVQDDGDDDLDVDAFVDEPSVIEIIRSNREAEGLEFNMEDDIDEACDMFIRRCRSRMNLN